MRIYSVSATARRCHRLYSPLLHTSLVASCHQARCRCDRRAIGIRSLLFLLRYGCMALSPSRRRRLQNTSHRCRSSSSPLLRTLVIASCCWSRRRRDQRAIGRRLLPALVFCSLPVASEQIPALPIPGVSPSHRRRATTGRPRTRRNGLRRRRAAAARTTRMDLE